MNYVSIGKLSKQSGITAASLRYYEGLGLIASRARKAGELRHYPDYTSQRLRAIKILQDLGFTLAEINALSGISGGKRQKCSRLHRRLTLKLAEVEKETRRYKILMEKLRRAIRQCKIKNGICQGELARLLGSAS